MRESYVQKNNCAVLCMKKKKSADLTVHGSVDAEILLVGVQVSQFLSVSLESKHSLSCYWSFTGIISPGHPHTREGTYFFPSIKVLGC